MIKILDKSNIYFFKDKPIFGLDIGFDTLRVMQIDVNHHEPLVTAYGSINYQSKAIEDGVIVKPDLIAEAVVRLFKDDLIGEIDTKRVAISLPSYRSFTRAVQLPKMKDKDITDAVQTEAMQYLPTSIDKLYLDHTTIRSTKDNVEVFVCAMPKTIVDSYLQLTKLLDLEVILFDTTVGACARLFSFDEQSDLPSLLIDFGSKLTDISIYNNNLVVTGTVAFGGDKITEDIARMLNVSTEEATQLKSQYGLSVSDVQKQINKSIEPSMDALLKEIRRNVRYYEERYSKQQKIGQIVTMGGGASMPGLAEHLTEKLLLPSRTFDLTSQLNFGKLKPIYQADRTSFETVAGLALTNPKNIFS